MKAVLISIQPKWCKKIASGEKTVEARKTYPKIPTPFKCYIYCTAGGGQITYADYCGYDMDTYENDFIANGTVIGEFTCSQICHMLAHPDVFARHPLFFAQALKDACLTEKDVEDYGGDKDVVGWVISDLKIYEKPKDLSEFRKPCDNDLYCESCGMYHNNTGTCGNAALKIIRPPQSWCYVEVTENENCG